MAFVSLFSRPPNPAIATHMPEYAGDERKEGELEDGEIDDAGLEEKQPDETKEETKEEEDEPSSEKLHKKSRKRKKKVKVKVKKKRRHREKHKHSSPASDDSSDNSYDSDEDDSEPPMYRDPPYKPPMYRDYDSHFSQYGHAHGSYMTSPKSLHSKKNPMDYDDYSNYSDGNYNEEEQEDFAEQLKHYRQAKESSDGSEPPYKKPCMRMTGADPQQKGYFYGRGTGPQKKNTMRKERGRGRGAHKGPNPYFQDGFQEENKPMKKWVTMSQEFISQHTVERKGKQICKYFLERRCIKGDQCKFDHDAEVEKKKEICKFYIQGYCTRGENCIYMHGKFPCKFYHTGVMCYQGDNCKFSHEDLNDDSKELLHKVLNTEEEMHHEDEEEPEEIPRHGAKFYSQSYTGMPFPANRPSMYNSEPLPETGPLTPPPQSAPLYGNPGMNAPFNASAGKGHGPDHQREGANAPGPPFLHSADEKLHGMHQQSSYQSGQSAPGFYDNYYSQQAVHHVQPSNMAESMHKVLFARIGKKMDGAESNNLPPQRSVSREEDEFANWYSSEEEDESGVSSILKKLRNQTKLAMSNSVEQQPATQTFDPKLTKDRAAGVQTFDPRVRTAQGLSPGQQVESVSLNPRAVRDPRKMKPSETSTASHVAQFGATVKQKGLDEDDEDAERELREKAAIIPLETLAGVNLRDPRCKLRQFSHIKMDIILSKPNFAKLIVWAPEDLLPVPPPKPDPVSSINLPLPPLIADQRLNKSRGLVSELHQSASDPRLEKLDPRLETKGKQASIAVKGTFADHTDSHVVINKLSDPRLQKSLQSRLHRSPSSDSQPAAMKDAVSHKVDPRLAARSAMGLSPTSVKPAQDVLSTYAPKLSPASSRLGTPPSILKNISLYNPRDTAAPSSDPASVGVGESEDQQKKIANPSKLCQNESGATDSAQQPTCPTGDGTLGKNTPSQEDSEDKSDCPDVKPEASNKPTLSQPSTAPAVHNLPIQVLSGLIRPQYSEQRQIKPAGPASQTPDTNVEVDEDDKPLKDVFKTFDPTASPFC
ncbi:zinc finger CCCH domain-containing protein 6 isoform X2 [Pseudophryne corroboree]|uniref:zinc finger CCCH domain-containing protein 6 isoform X2 n=1 Tax=Pseudophryne corroboree TaxID=495146 RepID=UPI003081B2A5